MAPAAAMKDSEVIEGTEGKTSGDADQRDTKHPSAQRSLLAAAAARGLLRGSRREETARGIL